MSRRWNSVSRQWSSRHRIGSPGRDDPYRRYEMSTRRIGQGKRAWIAAVKEARTAGAMRRNHTPWGGKRDKQVAGRYIGCGARGCRVVRCWFVGWKGWALRLDRRQLRLVDDAGRGDDGWVRDDGGVWPARRSRYDGRSAGWGAKHRGPALDR